MVRLLNMPRDRLCRVLFLQDPVLMLRQTYLPMQTYLYSLHTNVPYIKIVVTLLTKTSGDSRNAFLKGGGDSRLNRTEIVNRC